MEYISSWNRVLSALTDIFVLRALLDIASLCLPQKFVQEGAVIAAILGLGIFVTYFLPRIFLKRRTIGMIVFDYTVLKNPKGKRLTWFEEFLRFISQWISALLLFLPFSFSLFSKKHTHLADLVVDAVPVKAEKQFSASRPLQKFIGVMLLSLALGISMTIFSANPAVDFFAHIFKGNSARIIQGITLATALGAGLVNLFGYRRAAVTGMVFYLILTCSALYSLIDFEAYKRRAVQNVRDTVNLASTQLTPGVNAGMIKNFMRDTETQINQSLPAATRFNFAVNFLQFLYMLYTAFPARFAPVRDFLRKIMQLLSAWVYLQKLRFTKETK